MFNDCAGEVWKATGSGTRLNGSRNRDVKLREETGWIRYNCTTHLKAIPVGLLNPGNLNVIGEDRLLRLMIH
jgi:hypothetical protein